MRYLIALFFLTSYRILAVDVSGITLGHNAYEVFGFDSEYIDGVRFCDIKPIAPLYLTRLTNDLELKLKTIDYRIENLPLNIRELIEERANISSKIINKDTASVTCYAKRSLADDFTHRVFTLLPISVKAVQFQFDHMSGVLGVISVQQDMKHNTPRAFNKIVTELEENWGKSGTKLQGSNQHLRFNISETEKCEAKISRYTLYTGCETIVESRGNHGKTNFDLVLQANLEYKKLYFDDLKFIFEKITNISN